MQVRITVKDFSDKSFEKNIKMDLPYGVYSTIKDGMEHSSLAEYGRAFDALCDEVESVLIKDDDYRNNWFVSNVEAS